jgi:hypothetical protein
MSQHVGAIATADGIRHLDCAMREPGEGVVGSHTMQHHGVLARPAIEPVVLGVARDDIVAGAAGQVLDAVPGHVVVSAERTGNFAVGI